MIGLDWTRPLLTLSPAPPPPLATSHSPEKPSSAASLPPHPKPPPPPGAFGPLLLGGSCVQTRGGVPPVTRDGMVRKSDRFR